MYIDDVLKEIRGKLKEKGYSSRKVSVKQRPGGYDYAIKVKVKSFDVDFDYVKNISKKHESYERDISGDILQGGNTFISVDFDHDLFSKAEDSLNDLATKILNTISNSPNGTIVAKNNLYSLTYYSGSNFEGMLFLNPLYITEKFEHKDRYYANDVYSIRRALVYLICVNKFLKEEDFILKQ